MDIQDQVRAKIAELIKKGNRMFKANVKLDNIFFVDKVSNHGSAGWNKRDGWYIRISNQSLAEYPEWMLEEIIPHEVAHNVAHWLNVNERPFGDPGHGEHWKTIAQALGSSGRVRPPTPGGTHIYTTQAGNKVRLNGKQHDMLQNQYKVLRDKQGNRITAAGYQRSAQ
jgi:predicted SprT family Zn-dependent metalloprotease